MELQNSQRQFARFPENSHFMIFATGSELCLRAECSAKSKPTVVAGFPDKRDMRQFWQFKLGSDKKSKYSIINVSLQLAMEISKHGAVLLRPPNNGPEQQFFMAHPRKDDDSGFVIRSTYEQEKALCLYGALQFREVDPNALNFVFRFEQQQQDHIARNSTLFVNSLSKKAMEAYGVKKGDKLVEATFHGGFNQRWFLKHIRNGWFQIENLGSKLNIDSSREGKIQVCQWLPNISSSQLWSFEQLENNKYRVRSCEKKESVLGTSHGYVTLVPNEDPTHLWILQGFQPAEAFEGCIPSPPPSNVLYNMIKNILPLTAELPRQEISYASNYSNVAHKSMQSNIDRSFNIPPPQIQAPVQPQINFEQISQISHHQSSIQTPSHRQDTVLQREYPHQTHHQVPQAFRQSQVVQQYQMAPWHPEQPPMIAPPSQDPEIEVLRMPRQVSHIRLNPTAQQPTIALTTPNDSHLRLF